LSNGPHFRNLCLNGGDPALIDGERAVRAIIVAAVAETAVGGAGTGCAGAEADGWRAHLDD